MRIKISFLAESSSKEKGQISRLAVTYIACFIHTIVSHPLVGPDSQTYLTMRLLEVAHSEPSATSWQQAYFGQGKDATKISRVISFSRAFFLWLITAIIM